MALARIITRSQACSRELAMDLLSRGYAVEIVSPDAIPDNLADLELRVEEDPGNQLVATVETHNGERSASLEFLHYLKAPMPDFMRRPPELQEVLPLVDEPSNGNDLLPLRQESAPAEVFQITIPVVAPLPEVKADFEMDAAPIAIPVMQPPAEVPTYFAGEEPIVATVATIGAETAIAGTTSAENRIVERLPEMQSSHRSYQSLRLDRSSGWLWGTVLTSCVLIVLAILLAFGLRRSGQASARNLGATVFEQAPSVSSESASARASDSGNNSTHAVASAISPTLHSEADLSQAVKAIPVTKSAPAIEKPRAKAAHRSTDDIIARDTVTYLDKRFEPRASSKPARKSQTATHTARPHRSSHHQGDVVAANKVTYLDKPAAKSAK
jgi:hypothetical protein